MNDAMLATIYAHCPQTRLDKEPLPEPVGFHKAGVEVKEDRAPYGPDTSSNDDFDSDALRDAEGLLDEALNLVGLMLAAVGNESDIRSMQTETALKAVERRLRTARIRVDEHDTCHARLLLAYRDLQSVTERGSE